MNDASNNQADRAWSAAEQRLLDLLADRAVFGLDAAEEQELESLLIAHPLRDPDALDRLAAAVAVTAADGAEARLPDDVRTRFGARALQFARRPDSPIVEPSGRRTAPAAAARGAGLKMAAAGLLCAVATLACVVMVVGRDLFRGPDRPSPIVAAPTGAADAAVSPPAKPTPTPAVLRDAMLAAVGDVVRLDCAAAVADEAKARGDVVWSGSRQRGFLRISGLAPNEPTETQYQIWIVEGGRGRPVAAGVFDVGREVDEVIVPILPRVFVQTPTTFVVTVEKPGGADAYSEERGRVLARVR